jgi:DNA-directed RNA polymerase subunit RPC12/RpoP
MSRTSEEMILEWNPQVLFSKTKAILPTKNFQIIDIREDSVGDDFTGTIKGLAEGKYTQKKVAVQLMISGSLTSNTSRVVIEGLGDDIAMVPVSLDEIKEGADSWVCLRCGATIEMSKVREMKNGEPIECNYCGHSLSIDFYRPHH